MKRRHVSKLTALIMRWEEGNMPVVDIDLDRAQALNYTHAGLDSAKDGVFLVKMRRRSQRDKELRRAAGSARSRV